MNETELKEALCELNSLCLQLLSMLVENPDEETDEDTYNAKLQSYKELRAEVLLELAKDFTIPKITNSELQKELKSFLKEGDELIAKFEKGREEGTHNFGKAMETHLRSEFTPDRQKKFEQDHFYSWFDASDYVYRLIETGTIVIKNIGFPEKLQSLILELRKCLIFENYLAAGIMLRTVVEVAVDDILDKVYADEEFEEFYEKLSFLEKESAFRIPASILNAYRKELNQYVHGEKIGAKEFVPQYVRIVLDQLEELYERVPGN